MIYELPPAPQGSAEEQLRALRDYLVRLSRELTRGGGSGSVPSAASSGGAAGGDGRRAETLKALIIKNANAADAAISALGERIESIDGLFFYIRYAPVEAPTAEQMTLRPQEDTAYMGVCSTSAEIAPTDPADYVWSRILGESALSVQIESSNGSIFKNGAVSTTLSVRIHSGGEDVTQLFDDNDFRWTRVSSDSAADELWNSAHFGGARQITLTPQDVAGRATFFCSIIDREEK